VPRLCGFYPGICLTTEEKARKKPQLYGAETWTLRAVDQKHLESFEMWCWRRMEKIIRTDHVRNEDVLLTVKEQRNILHVLRKWKAN
jgi:hypothetical protein